MTDRSRFTVHGSRMFRVQDGCCRCQQGEGAAKTAAESTSVLFLLKQYRHNAAMRRTSFLPWQQLGLDPPVTDGALGSDFQPQTLWPSITECQSFFLLAAPHPPFFIYFFPSPHLSLRTARDISWRVCCQSATRKEGKNIQEAVEGQR